MSAASDSSFPPSLQGAPLLSAKDAQGLALAAAEVYPG